VQVRLAQVDGQLYMYKMTVVFGISRD